MASIDSNKSTHGLTFRPKLLDFDGLNQHDQTIWEIKLLGFEYEDGTIKSKVQSDLAKWSINKDFKKLLNSLKYVAQDEKHLNPNRVKPDKENREIYEIKAPNCCCRLFFFYDTTNGRVVICTNGYWKGKGHHDKDQEAAFNRCAQLKELYFKEQQHIHENK